MPVTPDSGASTTDGATAGADVFVLPPAEPSFDGPGASEARPPVARDAAVDADPVGTFAGVWEYQSGMTSWECTGATPAPSPTKGYTVTFHRSKQAPLAISGSNDGNGCEYPVDVASPSEVVGRPEHVCAFTSVFGDGHNKLLKFRLTLEGGMGRVFGVNLHTITAPASKGNVCTVTTEGVVTRTVPY